MQQINKNGTRFFDKKNFYNKMSVQNRKTLNKC